MSIESTFRKGKFPQLLFNGSVLKEIGIVIAMPQTGGEK